MAFCGSLWSWTLRLLLLMPTGTAMENGAARSPPLGWSSWNGFGMSFNASLVRRTAHAMKERGLLSAGYKLLTLGGSTYEHAGAASFDFHPWKP